MKGSVFVALISVTPLTDITALIASNNVNEGDVLLLEEGIYFQTVNITKNNIRIVSKSPGVIFDGKDILLVAFTLSNVVGVEIEGINIRHYVVDAIFIESGSGNRIINNRINNVLNDGIFLFGSSGNLIWKNEICRCFNGILLILGSTSNWVIENAVRECLNNGFETNSVLDSNNAFISNISTRNESDGFELFGSNNLLMNSLSMDNAFGIIFDQGRDSLAIGNMSKGIKFGTHFIVNGYINHFAGENCMICNRRKGIEILGQLGMFINNEISNNTDIGMELTASSEGNLIMNNKLICNIPENIVSSGTDNNFINNVDEPCEPCETPSDLCGYCSE